jgi:predicted MFS family arabinose efflux permease
MSSVHGLRRNSDFQRYSAAQAVSVLGSRLSFLAFPLLVLSLHGSAAQAGLIASCTLVARTACQLPAGQVADRFDRRRLMLGCDLVCLAAMGGVALMVSVHTTYFPLLLVVAVVSTVSDTFFSPAASVVVRDLVSENQLTEALGRSQTNSAAASLVGPLLGGWLFTVGPVVPFACDAVSYGLSAVLILGITRRPAEASAVGLADRRLTAGLRWLARQPMLQRVLLFAAVINLVGAATDVAIVVSLRGHGASGTVIGAVMACAGVGGLAGAAVSSRLVRLVGPARLLVLIGACWTGGFVVFAVFPGSAWVAGTVLVLLLALSPAAVVVIGQSLLGGVPKELMGRVGAAASLLMAGLSALGPVLVGAGFELAGQARTWLLLALLTGLATLVTGPPMLRSSTFLGGSAGRPEAAAQRSPERAV